MECSYISYSLYHMYSDIFIVDHNLPAMLCTLELNDNAH